MILAAIAKLSIYTHNNTCLSRSRSAMGTVDKWGWSS